MRFNAKKKLNGVIHIASCILFFTTALFAQTTNNFAPGGPGKEAQWANAGKEGIGASNTLESKVWFTLQGGVMTEVYYPDVTVANVQELQFIVFNPKTKKVETERNDAIHRLLPNYGRTLIFEQRNKAKSGEWEIWKNYVTDPDRDTVLFSLLFRTKNKDLKLYLYYDPSLNNSGMHDTAWTQKRDVLLASDGDKCSALTTFGDFKRTTNGFLGTSDGLTQLRKKGNFTRYERAENGNVVQLAEIEAGKFSLKDLTWNTKKTFALGFGNTSEAALINAQATLKEGFTNIWLRYRKGWGEYLKTVRKVDPKYQAQFNMAAMVLKAHEDKTYRGANIASLSIPWGGGPNANEPNVGGYHLVWSRDLYQVATAYIALGDKAAADRALNYLFKYQQKPDGSFPQNSWLDGRPFWDSLQLDEVAFPLILAYQLGRTDNETYIKRVRPAANFIIKNGPVTPQERWEEEKGYSPSTIAAEIAGLVCAAEIAKQNDDQESAKNFLATADDWAKKIETWTATTNGKYADGNYYLRLTQRGNPNAGDKLELNNGAGFFDEREVIDAGFLELVRLGVKSPNDPLIVKSVAVVDKVIRVGTPNGEAFYRYNNDGYGEMDDGRPWNFDGKYTGKGRLWVLLAGERGQYELALGASDKAKKRLDAMMGFANQGMMIPEQVWDKPIGPGPDFEFGEGTGSATPLAWSMAQFIRLAVNIQEGRNLDTPDVVLARYVKRTMP
jgi:glucoamylase